ncbi:MAG: JAB domain-containing protein [Candidatus Omnitrophota bacterium]
MFKNYFGHEVKIQLVRESKPVKEYIITEPKDIYELVKDELKSSDREIFLSVQLNTRNQVLGINIVSVGTLNASMVHPREVFKPAILQNAAGIILVHNHPSENEEPSEDDLTITNKLSDAGKLLDIDVLDHIIVGKSFYSFLDKGLIKNKKGD